jgi:riboflavin synthase
MPEPTVGSKSTLPESPDKAKAVRSRQCPRVGLMPWGVLAICHAENVHVHHPWVRRLPSGGALMFTGIIQATGRVTRSEPRGGDLRLGIVAPEFDTSDVALGESVAVSGCCLTVVAHQGDTLAFDISNESLALTTLGDLGVGDRVNLEKALRLSDRLGGHLVSGHVDDIGRIVSIQADARSQRWVIEAPPALARYIAAKGSVCVDGVSLTVNTVEGARFGVNLIPHTLEQTSFGDRRVGDRVNLEIDMLARYVERLLATGEQ